MGFTVSIGTDHLHSVGNSFIQLSAFDTMPGGLLDQINGRNPARVSTLAGVPAAGAQASVSGGIAGVASPGTPPGLVFGSNYTNSGVTGNRIADIDVPSRITAFAPTKLIWEIGVNDANLGTVPATFFSTFQTKITAAFAANPQLTQMLLMTPMCIGELWQAGSPVWGANPKDAAVDAICAQIVALVAANPNVFLADMRTPAGAWLQAHAPGPPGAAQGLLTYDQFHPPALGCVLLGQWVMQNVTVVA